MTAPALLIIDMQNGMASDFKSPATGERNNPQAETLIAALLAHWRQTGAPVVHVRRPTGLPVTKRKPHNAGSVSSWLSFAPLCCFC